MDLPTYTNIWRIEKRLYKLYDFRLPMPLPLGQIAVFTAIAVPYVVVLAVLGLPFSHTLLWLYVLPPAVLAWFATRPVLESKRLPELVASQLRYLGEPRTWCRMAPLAEQDEVIITARVWRRAAQAVREDRVEQDAVAARDGVAEPDGQGAFGELDGLTGRDLRDGDANREDRADREEQEPEAAARSAVAQAAYGVQAIGAAAGSRTSPAVPGPAVPRPAVPGRAVAGPAVPGRAVPGRRYLAGPWPGRPYPVGRCRAGGTWPGRGRAGRTRSGGAGPAVPGRAVAGSRTRSGGAGPRYQAGPWPGRPWLVGPWLVRPGPRLGSRPGKAAQADGQC